MSLSKEKRKGSKTRALKSFQQKAKTTRNFAQIYQKAKEVKNKQKGLTNYDLVSFLNCTPHFLGCFSDDEISKLVIKPPCFVIINLDISTRPGSHWLALGIFPNSIEVFDSLGFEIFSWPTLPHGLLKFLHKLSFRKRIKIIPRLQSKRSTLCGLFCVFYILLRSKFSLSTILGYFSSSLASNDSKLIKFFRYKCNFLYFRLNEMENDQQEAEVLDYKITKRHYPRTHTENCLEFVFDRDPNLFLRKDKIFIRGAIEVHEDYVVENGFAAKLFSLMTIEIDSQTISQSNNRYVFTFYY